eukprot:Clim_evm7s3 gene=Clim_evmTU7s3
MYTNNNRDRAGRRSNYQSKHQHSSQHGSHGGYGRGSHDQGHSNAPYDPHNPGMSHTYQQQPSHQTPSYYAPQSNTQVAPATTAPPPPQPPSQLPPPEMIPPHLMHYFYPNGMPSTQSSSVSPVPSAATLVPGMPGRPDAPVGPGGHDAPAAHQRYQSSQSSTSYNAHNSRSGRGSYSQNNRSRFGSSDPSQSSPSSDSCVLHISNLPEDVRPPHVVKLLAQYGKVVYLSGVKKDRSTMLLQMDSPAVARKVANLRGDWALSLAGRQLRVQLSNHVTLGKARIQDMLNYTKQRPSNTLCLTIFNELYVITIDAVKTICSPYGTVNRIVTVPGQQTRVLVEFENVESAGKAAEALHAQDIYDGACSLRVEYSQTKTLSVRANNEDSWDYTRDPEKEGPYVKVSVRMGEERDTAAHRRDSVASHGKDRRDSHRRYSRSRSPSPRDRRRGRFSERRSRSPSQSRSYSRSCSRSRSPRSRSRSRSLSPRSRSRPALTDRSDRSGSGSGTVTDPRATCVLLLTDLPKPLTEPTLIQHLLCQAGNVVKINCMVNKPKGMAMVQFENVLQASVAKQVFDGCPLRQSRIFAGYSKYSRIDIGTKVYRTPRGTGAAEDFLVAGQKREKSGGSATFVNVGNAQNGGLQGAHFSRGDERVRALLPASQLPLPPTRTQDCLPPSRFVLATNIAVVKEDNDESSAVRTERLRSAFVEYAHQIRDRIKFNRSNAFRHHDQHHSSHNDSSRLQDEPRVEQPEAVFWYGQDTCPAVVPQSVGRDYVSALLVFSTVAQATEFIMEYQHVDLSPRFTGTLKLGYTAAVTDDDGMIHALLHATDSGAAEQICAQFPYHLTIESLDNGDTDVGGDAENHKQGGSNDGEEGKREEENDEHMQDPERTSVTDNYGEPSVDDDKEKPADDQVKNEEAPASPPTKKAKKSKASKSSSKSKSKGRPKPKSKAQETDAVDIPAEAVPAEPLEEAKEERQVRRSTRNRKKA